MIMSTQLKRRLAKTDTEKSTCVILLSTSIFFAFMNNVAHRIQVRRGQLCAQTADQSGNDAHEETPSRHQSQQSHVVRRRALIA